MCDGAALDVLARTIYGEARGEPWLGKVAVGWVVRNRVTHGGWWGRDIESVCRKPYQFSCWNANDPNHMLLEQVGPEQPAYRECVAAAALVMGDLVADPTHGSTHYFAQGIPWPKWAIGHTPAMTIGRHAFFRDIS